jgi:hypothetical protein
MSSKKKIIIKTAISKIPLKDVGKSPDIMMEKPMADKVHYPSIYVSSDEAPFLEGCKVGDEEVLIVKVKITSTHEREYNGEVKCDYCLDIIKMGKPIKD